MAYVDMSNAARLNPGGAAATIGINLLFLVGIASMTPQVAAIVNPPTNVTFSTNNTDPPKTPPIKTPPVSVTTKAPAFTPITPITFPPLPPVNFTIDPPPPIPFHPVAPVDPVLPAQPVITTARYDMRFASAMQPEYPISLARAEIEGSVLVNVLVGADGRVKDVVSIRSDDPGFFEATRNHALRKWRFKPAMRDGVAIESWREMRVKFQMPDRFE
jgi:protein TonB